MASQPVHRSCCLDHMHNRPTVDLQGLIACCPAIGQRFTKIIQSNKGRGSITRVLGTGTVVDTISEIAIIRESRGICPNISTRVAICDGNTFNIVGVDVICRWLETISGVVLVAPSLSTDLAVVMPSTGYVTLEHPGRWLILSLPLKVSRGSAHQQNHHHGGDGSSMQA